MFDSEVVLRTATPDDLKPVMAALSGLARDLGDPFRATPDGVMRMLFSKHGYGFSVLAMDGPEPVGIVLCAPIFSTAQGGTCVYVSDLWVAEVARGRSLGQRLLRAAMTEGRKRWQAEALRLIVYDDNGRAMAFYDRLGFTIQDRDRHAVLRGDALSNLMGEQG